MPKQKVTSMPEKKSERKAFVLIFFNSLFATPAQLPSLGCPPPTATAPGALGAHGRALCRSATTQTALSTGASVPARTLDRHRPRYGSTFPPAAVQKQASGERICLALLLPQP